MATQVGLEFPSGEDPTERLDQLVEQFEQGEAGGLAVSFYTIDNPEAAEEVRKRFPNAEIITNVSTALETSEARGEIQRPRRRMR